ncbi:hypothetical protein QBC46DRAFT_387696 [Diplogelasinospora grovesii]|uniref:PHD-type domain-containing protein n=1 Tax=Diplogelasinospora grovesii TaxID=303347 RepID=A0AAN6N630_9PEZI|nr:hypothetical protein QBC46DRAFT_387696 [Diplogelasinospora grovesii]
MSMNTSASMTMQMPAPPPPAVLPPPPPPPPLPTITPSSLATTTAGRRALAPAPAGPGRPPPGSGSAGAGMSAIRRISSGLSLSGTGVNKSAAASKASAIKVLSADSKVKKRGPGRPPGAKNKKPVKGQKKKNGDGEDDEDETSSLSSLSEVSDTEAPAPAAGTPAPSGPTTTTKSGRQVLKPLTFNPTALDSSSSRKRHYGKRTAEQALCKKCTRMHSPAANQMVFCDGCNEGWHQMCHDPWIGDDLLRDQSRAWFCAECQAKRDRHFGKKPKLTTTITATVNNNNTITVGKEKQQKEKERLESWADKTAQQKRAYLSTLPQSELVGLLMASLEMHPDLPIFPSSNTSGSEPVSAVGSPSLNSHNGGRAKQKNGIGSVVLVQQKEEDKENEDDEEFDPLSPPWPKAGMGLYNRLLPLDEEDKEHLVDDDDYEAFSVIIFDERGRKVEENGMRV